MVRCRGRGAARAPRGARADGPLPPMRSIAQHPRGARHVNGSVGAAAGRPPPAAAGRGGALCVPALAPRSARAAPARACSGSKEPHTHAASHPEFDRVKLLLGLLPRLLLPEVGTDGHHEGDGADHRERLLDLALLLLGRGLGLGLGRFTRVAAGGGRARGGQRGPRARGRGGAGAGGGAGRARLPGTGQGEEAGAGGPGGAPSWRRCGGSPSSPPEGGRAGRERRAGAVRAPRGRGRAARLGYRAPGTVRGRWRGAPRAGPRRTGAEAGWWPRQSG
jgi:hypothetical protein